MKRITAILLMLSLAAFAGDKDKHDHDHSGHKHDHDGHAHKTECELKDGEAHASIQLSTIQCGMCVKTVTKALNSVEGVNMAKVDLEQKSAHVHFADKELKVANLENAISAAGYDANDTKRNEKAHAKLPKCCQSER
jgi:copper chaperone CopZ